jgi:hypothetical protein
MKQATKANECNRRYRHRVGACWYMWRPDPRAWRDSWSLAIPLDRNAGPGQIWGVSFSKSAEEVASDNEMIFTYDASLPGALSVTLGVDE